MNTNSLNIILFDGVCHLCNGTVNFLIKRDKKKHFHFAALQSDSGQSLLEQHQLSTTDLDTIIYLENGHCYTMSTAALKILKRLGHGWQLFYALIIIPRFIRDLIYNFVARHRYRLFGKSPQCMLPSNSVRDRFL